jgi:hypothetical protein
MTSCQLDAPNGDVYTISFGKPVQVGDDYKCLYKMEGPGMLYTVPSWGVDGVSALLSALYTANLEATMMKLTMYGGKEVGFDSFYLKENPYGHA